MRRNDEFIDQNFTWFTGIVEDINDTKAYSRVKVRALGFYTMDKGILPTADLPWATVLMPNTSASKAGVGSTHELMVDSWVVGFFRDGPSAQDPVIIGSIPTKTEEVIDVPVEAQLENITNKVHKTEAGHLIEFDNTLDKERINIKHGKNTSTLNIDVDGITILQSTGTGDEPKTHTLTLDPSANTINLLHHSGTTINISSEGTVTIDAFNDIVNIDGNTTITGTLHATGDISTDAGNAPTLATHLHKSTSKDTGDGSNAGVETDTSIPDA